MNSARSLATFYPGIGIVLPLIGAGIGFMIYKWSLRGVLTTEYLKILFGFMLLLMLAGLAGLIIFENVQASNSAGLEQIITIISVLSGAFAQWAFTQPKESGTEKRDQSAHAKGLEVKTS